MSVCQK